MPDSSSKSGEGEWQAAKLARRVSAARAAAGLTQAELAEATGVTDETISRIERGRYEPAVSTLFRLAEALDVSLDALAGERERERPRERERERERGRRGATSPGARVPPISPGSPRSHASTHASGWPGSPGSPLLRRLQARIATLTPAAQRKLLAIALLLPEARPPRSRPPR